MNETPRARLIAYSLAVLAPVMSLLLRWPLWPVLEDRLPHMTFLPAVALAAYYGGLRPGLLATLLSAIAAACFLLTTQNFLPSSYTYIGVGVCLFVLTGVILSGLSESLHQARHRIVADERRRADEAMRATEERFRQLAELLRLSYDAIVVWKLDGGIETWSRGAEELYGYGEDEALGRVTHELLRTLHPVPWPEIEGKLRAGGSWEGEIRHWAKDGREVIVSTRLQFVRDAHGVARVLEANRDITDRKRAEAALRESEMRLHRILDALPTPAYTCDAAGLITYFNERATELWGRSPKLNHSDDRFCGSFKLFEIDGTVIPLDQCGMAVAIKTEREIKGIEVMVERSDGSRRNILAHINPMWDPEGRLVGAVNVVVDITERKRAEELLRESEQRWRSLTEALPQLVWTATPDGACDYFSTQWTQHTGIAASKLLGWQWLEALHPDDREATRKSWTNSVAAGGTYDVEYRVRRLEGEYRWFKTRGVPIRDSAGGIFKWFGTCTDITESKLAQEELRLAKEAAESANRAKDEFLANVSHEIRTPMNAILGMTEMALDTPLADDQRQCLKTVKSAADNLLGIINDLLDFSKIEAGKLDLDPADFSLRAELGDTLRALAVRAHRKGLELVCQVLPDVPDALVGDAGRLRQILLNLVGNAIKFTDEGEVVIRAEVACDEATEKAMSLRFTVRDTGIGIPQNRQEKIFRAFEQEDTSTTRKYGGTGLGLTIAARLVALMGGQIAVESEPSCGSTFFFTARFGTQPHSPERKTIPPPAKLQNLPVLIVDDNATNRRILEEWLRGWQMKPVAVGDGVAAMDAIWHGTANGRPYPLVLLDARMPDTDGLTLASQIRQRAELSGTRIILLTSGGRPGDSARFREQRVDAHLLKPVQQDELLETIYRVMSTTNGSPVSATSSGFQERTPTSKPVDAALRILVAEDNEFNSQLLEQLLVRQGHGVRLAKNGREAVSLAEEGAFDLLLLDVHMPEMDGFQAIQAIRERERSEGGHLPVIALTARSRSEDREQCLAGGMDDFLSKPIQAADLWVAIRRVVNTKLPPDQPASDLIDPQVLVAACGGDADILEKISRTFRARLPEHLTAVEDALGERDTHRLREAAHKICGMLGAFSTVAGGVASDLEDRAAQGQLDEAKPLVGQVKTMANELLRLTTGLSLETLQQRKDLADDSHPLRES
jgi:two-component system sensor histidine kinase/response regulator